MFEKEVKKYLEDSIDYYDPREPFTSRKVLQMCMDCAELGYNKAMDEVGRRTESANREGMAYGRDIAMEEIRALRQDCVKLSEQLTEAKEIIKQFLNDYPVITKELLDKLEQFVKEIKEND